MRTAVRVATLALLWGSGFFWIKLSLRGLTPSQVLALRLLLGAVTLLVLLRRRGRRLPAGRRTWVHLAVAAVFGNVVPYLLFAVAEQRVDSAVAGMLNATTPLWTVLIAVAARQSRRPGVLQLAGTGVGFLGAVLILAPWSAGARPTGLGAVWCLVAALSYAVGYVYIARFLSAADADPLGLSAGQLVVAAALSAVLLPFTGGFRPPELRADAVAAVVVLGVAGTGLAYVINYRLIHDDGAVLASTVVYLLPVVAVLLGVVLLGERLTGHATAGTAVVLAGVALARRAPGVPAGSGRAAADRHR